MDDILFPRLRSLAACTISPARTYLFKTCCLRSLNIQLSGSSPSVRSSRVPSPNERQTPRARELALARRWQAARASDQRSNHVCTPHPNSCAGGRTDVSRSDRPTDCLMRRFTTAGEDRALRNTVASISPKGPSSLVLRTRIWRPRPRSAT